MVGGLTDPLMTAVLVPNVARGDLLCMHWMDGYNAVSRDIGTYRGL